jgi:Flavin-binding monooxygenase-like
VHIDNGATPACVRVAVIGAGAAGLVTARELRRAGHEAVVFERGGGVGGTWRYQEGVEPDLLGAAAGGRVHSSMYASLRTNLPTKLMAFRDFPFEGPASARADGLWFCGHRDVQAYLERFVAHFELGSGLRLGTSVDHLASADSGWRLRLRDASDRETMEEVDAVAICNGHYSRPRVPELPGRFTGAQSHSHNYRRPDPFAGQRVVILGARSSGTDLSLEIAQVAAEVHLCAREYEVSRRIGPNLVAEPTVVGLGPGRQVGLADGRVLHDVDHLLFCTGYRYAFPFLDAPGLFECTGDEVGPLYLDLVPPATPTLALIGLPFAVVPFPLMEAQARWWALSLAATLPWPSPGEMQHEIRARAEALATQAIPRRHRLRYSERQFDYVDALSRRAGAPELPSWFAALYRTTREAKGRDPAGYRDAAW